jgi:hypothetical protein
MLRSALEEYVSSASSCVNCLGKSVAKSLNGASELHLEVIETVRSQPGGAFETVCVREFRLLKGIAEGTYNTKHAEAARLYYTTILLYYDTTTHTHTHRPTEL